MTARPHPAVAEVRRAVRSALTDLDPGAHLLVACSGGADSMALAGAALFEGRKAGWMVGAIVVDHGLQPGSAAVGRDVVARLVVMGCEDAQVVRVQVGSGGGPEAAARDARLATLDAAAAASDAVVLLGHTLDDQAETVLLGLARGSGTRSLSGMPAVTGRFRRPLLGVRRTQTHQACQAGGVDIWDDPHNLDRRFARVRVRLDALPAMEAALGPGVAEALARTAAATRADADTLEALAEELLAATRDPSGVVPSLDAAALAVSRPALRRRVLRAAAVEAGSPSGDLFVVHVEELERLVTDWHGQGPLNLPGGIDAWRQEGRIRFGVRPAGPA